MKKDFVFMFIQWYKRSNWFYSAHVLEFDDEREFKHPVTRTAFYAYRGGYNKAIRDLKNQENKLFRNNELEKAACLCDKFSKPEKPMIAQTEEQWASSELAKKIRALKE